MTPWQATKLAADEPPRVYVVTVPSEGRQDYVGTFSSEDLAICHARLVAKRFPAVSVWEDYVNSDCQARLVATIGRP